MSKGLAIARSFYRAGHKVIGADFEPHSIPVCGRFSSSLHRFHRLRKPSKASGSQEYISDLLEIVKNEGVELWVSCSGVASAVEDGEAKEALEEVGVLAVQFGVETTALLHEKDSFIRNTQSLGLNVPETHLIVRTADALSILHPPPPVAAPKRKKTYILKPVGMNDSVRADMTRLPLKTPYATTEFILKMNPSGTRPFVLQEFVEGSEYCTHSIAIRGRIKAFAACESSELLMHYRALPPTSTAFKAMLRYTELYAERMGKDFTGHFSIDFLLQSNSVDSEPLGHGKSTESMPSKSSSSRTKSPFSSQGSGRGFTGHFSTDFLFHDSNGNTPIDGGVEHSMGRLFPIECNPRAHTAAVLFADQSVELCDAYLSLLPDYATLEKGSEDIVMPSLQTVGYHWIGHDVVTRVLLPFLDLIALKAELFEVLGKWEEFLTYLIFWRDGTWETWDPWPFWWLYTVYWPGMFLMSVKERSWWSRCNVSTTKLFRC